MPNAETDDLKMHSHMRLRITHGLQDRKAPYLG